MSAEGSRSGPARLSRRPKSLSLTAVWSQNPRVRPRTILALMLGVGVLLVAVPLLFTFLFSRPIVFHPTSASSEAIEAAAQRAGFGVEELPLNTGETLVGAVRTSTAPQRKLLLFFGGNAFDLPSSIYVADLVAGRLPLDVAAFAYRGYDGSSGAPSAWGLAADAVALAGALRARFPGEPLILMGQSLGTGVAARLAAELADAGAPPEALILVSPFRSVARLFDEAVPLLPLGLAVRDRFDTEALAGRIRSRVLIVHGDRDALIPIEHGRTLARLLGPRAELLAIPGAGHGDVWDHDQSRAAVTAFLARPGPAP